MAGRENSNRNRPAADLVLASASPYRAKLMQSAGLVFSVMPPSIDERAIEDQLADSGMGAADLAEILAIAKARSVAESKPDSVIVGCDQTLSLADEILHKPENMEAARRRLLQLSGRTHDLNSAICLVEADDILWSDVSTCHITFRKLDPGFVGRHLAKVGEIALSSVGAYQIEGAGIQLVDKIEGDFFAVMGLPLLPLLAQLRKFDLIDY